MSTSSGLLYYFIQNDRGESSSFPNCCRLPPGCGGGAVGSKPVLLSDVLSSFPLIGSGSFHFRFQVTQDGTQRYLDLTHPADTVPTVAGGNVFAKVLRLDTLIAQARPGFCLPPFRPITSLPPLNKSSNNTSKQSTISIQRANANSSSSSSSSSSASMPSPIASTPLPTMPFAMPTMKTGGPGGAHHVVPKEEDGETHIRDDGTGTDIYAAMKKADASGMRPVKAITHDESPVEVPNEVDEDLDGKSDLVKAKVMARRAELKRVQAERQEELDKAATSDAKEVEEKDAARREFEAKINAWHLEPTGGQPRPIRVLLTSLHNVLWEGSGWEPLGLDKVIIPAKVRIHFMKACTKVHPDKQSQMSAAQRYIATQVFAALTTSFREFEEKEMK